MRTRYYTFSPPTLPLSLSLSLSLSLALSLSRSLSLSLCLSVSLYLSLSLSLSLSLCLLLSQVLLAASVWRHTLCRLSVRLRSGSRLSVCTCRKLVKLLGLISQLRTIYSFDFRKRAPRTTCIPHQICSYRAMKNYTSVPRQRERYADPQYPFAVSLSVSLSLSLYLSLSPSPTCVSLHSLIDPSIPPPSSILRQTDRHRKTHNQA